MKIINSPIFKKYLLPGFVFQSVVIAGGYGTGREIIEYFLNYGPGGGLLGMLLISTVMWSLTIALSFEFARLFKSYDYRTFFQNMLGKWWFMFELLYLGGALIILAVVGSAAGVLLRDNFGIPYFIGVLLMFVGVGILTFKGSGLIEKFLASWSVVLYLVYIVIIIAAFYKFSPAIKNNFSNFQVKQGWALGGFKYALYNFVVIPAVLFCTKHIEKRKEAISAGLLAGLIGILPGFLFYISVISQYPAVLTEELPMIFMLEKIGSGVLLIVFQFVLFGTLIETGTGLIHAFNERILSWYISRGKEFPDKLRPLVSVILLSIGLGIAQFGLIDLIAKGYGGLSWATFFIFVIPLFSIGLFKIIKNKNRIT